MEDRTISTTTRYEGVAETVFVLYSTAAEWLTSAIKAESVAMSNSHSSAEEGFTDVFLVKDVYCS